MINLVEKNLAGSSDSHTWRALEEMLSFGIFQDSNINDIKTKQIVLRYIFNFAKLRIKESSVNQKFRNYLQAKSGDYSHCNQYSVDIIKSFAADPKFKKTVQELINNKWSAYSQRAGRPSVFVNHTVSVLFSKEYIKKGFPKYDASFFEKRINEYLDFIYQNVTAQHYIEHANAIGHLDKIVFVTKEEAAYLKKDIEDNSVEEINDYMGLFIPSARQIHIEFSHLFLLNGEIKEKETLIILCPESMSEMMKYLKKRVSIDTMIDKVFSHEIGHLAFYFYAHEWKKRTEERCSYKKIAEKQANWISSIAHGGSLDELISEVAHCQPPQYQYPLVLSDNVYPDYEHKVEQLYLR